MLTVDVTDQVRARQLLEERAQRQVALQQAIAAVPGQNLVISLQQVADALVSTLPVDVIALRLLDPDGRLHLVAAAGLRPDEIRRLAPEPLDERRIEAVIEGGSHPLLASVGLRWVAIHWLKGRDGRIGSLTLGVRSERRLSEDELALLETAAALLSEALEPIDRTPGLLRSRSLELARSYAHDEARHAPLNDLRPRELAILRLCAEGPETNEIAELLVLSAHTVRTHVRNALRRLGVSSRSEALKQLELTDGVI